MARALVEILEVALAPDDAGRFAVHAIDRPAAGETNDNTYSLDVRGRVSGGKDAVVAIELCARGAALARIPLPAPPVAGSQADEPDEGRFYAPIGSLALPARFELTVEAEMAGGERAAVATIRGRRAPLRTRFEPRRQPLMLTSPGRSGTTIFMRLLEGHPGIAAYRPSSTSRGSRPTGSRCCSRFPIRPAGCVRSRPPARCTRGGGSARGTPAVRRLSRPAIQNWLGSEGVEELGEFCMARIDAVYDQVAGLEGGGGERYFAEKFQPDAIPELAWELYPGAREVILVRDLRDMVASIFASSAKRGAQELPADGVSFIAESVKRRAGAAAEAWRARSGRAHLLRYEDLIERPEEALAGVLEYLEIDSSSEAVAAMRAHAEEPIVAMERHRTTPDPAASIGRWQRDLSEDLQKACARTLVDELRLFGYER